MKKEYEKPFVKYITLYSEEKLTKEMPLDNDLDQSGSFGSGDEFEEWT